MTVLTSKQIRDRFPVSPEEVSRYLERHKLPYTLQTIPRRLRNRIRRRIRNSKIRHAPGFDVSHSYSAQEWQVIYGKFRVGGLLSFINTVANNTQLDMVHTIACHEIHQVTELWLDEEKVIFGASPDPRWSTGILNPATGVTRPADTKVFMTVNDGNPANPAISDLTARTPLWTATDKQQGRAHAFIILVSDAVLFPDGVPEITFIVEGKKCYDPRSATTAYTNNAALCLLDYLTDTNYGMGVPLADCETDEGENGSFYDAADVCDESISLAGGGSEARYTINGAFGADESPQNVLEKMCTAMAGFVAFVNGKWRCYPGVYRQPVGIITEDDCLAGLSVQAAITRRDIFNGVRGTFTSAAKNYFEDDFPAVKNDFYKSLDNDERIWEDVDMPFTTSAPACQRIAKILLEEARQQLTVAGTFKLGTYPYAVGENVFLVNDRLGWKEPRENLITWSEDFTKPNWSIIGATASAPTADYIGPFGQNAGGLTLLTETTSSTNHVAFQDSQSFEIGQTILIKVFIREGGRGWSRIRVVIFNGAANVQDAWIYVSLTTGAITSSGGTVQNARTRAFTAPDGLGVDKLWVEATFEVTIAAANTHARLLLYGASGSSSDTYTGIPGTILVFGGALIRKLAQCELYIPTTDAAITAKGTGKIFNIEETSLVLEQDQNGVPRVALQSILRETAPEVYNWNNGEETPYDPSPNSELPNPYNVQEPTGLLLESGTAQLYVNSDGTVTSRLKVSWDAMDDGFVTEGGVIEIQSKNNTSPTWQATATVPGNFTEYFILDVQDGEAYDCRIRAKNALGIVSDFVQAPVHVVQGKSEPPSQVTGFVAAIAPYGALLTWNQVPDLDVLEYELRKGAVGDPWESMSVIAIVNTTRYEANLQTAGTTRFAVKAIDTSGNESTSASFADAVIAGPAAPILSFAFDGPNLVLSWNDVASQFAVARYIIRYGASFAGGTEIGTVNSTLYQEEVLFGGTRKFWVAGQDVADNIGTPSSIDVTIIPPSAVTGLSAQVIDNNVLLRWAAPSSGSLPLAYYRVLKGATFVGAIEIGQVSATFSAIIETVGGTFTYWVVPVDTAGNEGLESSLTAIVSQPPDYVLRAEATIDHSNYNYLTNAFVDIDNCIVGPIDSTRSWQSHFSGLGYTNIQDQIDDGYPLYIQPGEVSLYSIMEWDDIDFAEVLPSTIVSLELNTSMFAGSATWTAALRHSTDGSSYTLVSGQQLSATAFRWLVPAFRYLRVTLEVTTSDRTAIFCLRSGNLRLDAKQISDSGGPLTAPATDFTQTATITIAAPAVVTSTAHGLEEGQQVELTTTGSLPTGLAINTIYFVRNPAADTFNLSSTPTGSLITTTGSQSGTHSILVRGEPVFFNREFIDVEGLTVTPTPTPAQRTANLPFTPVVSFKDAAYNSNFNVEVYDNTGARVACDFRWQARGV